MLSFSRQPNLQMRVAFTCLCFVVCLLLAASFDTSVVQAQEEESTAVDVTFALQYAASGGPRNLVAQGPGRIWYTASDAGSIGLIEVTSEPGVKPVTYRNELISFGENSLPYDIDYDSARGLLWFTLKGIRAIGKIDVTTTTYESEVFTLLSVGAAPMGIDVDPQGRVWIAQTNGRISRFDPTTETFTEFPLDEDLAQRPRTEDIVYQDDRNIIFTMPDANLVVTYDSVRGRFYDTPTGELKPMGLTLDPQQRIWVTANGSSKVGRFTPTTVSIWIWYETPTPVSGPAGLIVFDDEQGVRQVWFAQNTTGSVGRIQLVNGFEVVNNEKVGPSTPAGNTWGIIRSSDGHIWVTDPSKNVLYELSEPFVQRLYMTSIQNKKDQPE